MAERILDRLSEFLPDLRDCIVERAVFSSDHFAAMQGATNGDFTHGLIHPEQMIGGRLLVPGSAHATPIANLLSLRRRVSTRAGRDVPAGLRRGVRSRRSARRATRAPARSAA
jgi:hypothetical protein